VHGSLAIVKAANSELHDPVGIFEETLAYSIFGKSMSA